MSQDPHSQGDKRLNLALCAIGYLRGRDMRFINFTAAFILLISAISVTATRPLAQSGQIPSAEPGKLTGMVVDPNEARINGAMIVIEKKGFRRELVADEEGFFQVSVPAGMYVVTAKSYGFQPVSRRRVYVKANSVRAINFKLFPKPIID